MALARDMEMRAGAPPGAIPRHTGDAKTPARLVFHAPGAAEPSGDCWKVVAQAMVPIRQEINAGIRQVDRKVDQLDRRVEKLESDVAEIKTDVGTIKQDVAYIKTQVMNR